MKPVDFAKAGVARIDEGDDFIPLEKLPGEPKNARLAGACTCACRVQVGPNGNALRGPAGDLVADPNACTCNRLVGVRVDEHGTPREVTEPCTPETARKERRTMNTTTRTDATEFALRLARATMHTTALLAWRSDAIEKPSRARTRVAGTLGRLNVEARSVPIVASTPNPVDGEAITSWDLERFEKNPTILWGHDTSALPIGVASDVSFDPAVGLKMVVTFASERANPLAACVAAGVAEGVIRAVSVGFEDLGGGRARLLEVSFVSVPADEDAGTPDLNDDAARARVSSAASELGRHGARVRKGKEPDDGAPERKARYFGDPSLKEGKEKDEARADATDNDLLRGIAEARAKRDEQARTAWQTRPTTRS